MQQQAQLPSIDLARHILVRDLQPYAAGMLHHTEQGVIGIVELDKCIPKIVNELARVNQL